MKYSQLQWWDNFCCTTKSSNYVHIHIHSFSDFRPYRFSQNIGWSSLCYTAGPHWPIIPPVSEITIAFINADKPFMLQVYSLKSCYKLNYYKLNLVLNILGELCKGFHRNPFIKNLFSNMRKIKFYYILIMCITGNCKFCTYLYHLEL